MSRFARATLLALLSISLAQTVHAQPRARTMWVVPSVEGLPLCDAAANDPRITTLAAAYARCTQLKDDGAAAITRLLNTLEPGGPKGRIQVGYTATLQLLDLYRKTPYGWEIDTARVDTFFRVVEKVNRPVVLYFLANHFDSQGPIAQELRKDPRNVMQFKNGKPVELDYFGYHIVPYTLQTDASIPINQYRFEALQYLAKRVKALPEAVQKRIVAITLAGEIHHVFPDFENGMGAYDNIMVTDYSLASISGFRAWLERKYGQIEKLNAKTGLSYATFSAVQAPSKDIRKEPLTTFGDHYDAFADGTLPLSGWLWDPQKKVSQLDLYVDGKRMAKVPYGLNRLDVYRLVESVTSANTGFRFDLDFSQMPAGKHRAQIIAVSGPTRSLLAERDFVVVPRDQGHFPDKTPASITGLKSTDSLGGVRSWLDLPKPMQDVYFNPLARDWNAYREVQVRDFLRAFYEVALKAGLPAEKLYSHQIIPQVNSTWNPQLFATGLSLGAKLPWKQGLNMYGGATDSAWVREFIAQRKIADYGVPEFNPQQWKLNGTHLAAMQSHYNGGARFISPYYFSVIPDRFKGGAEHGVNRMELRPDNPKDGSDHFYRAIIEFAKQ